MPIAAEPRTTVAVRPADALRARTRLFGALEAAFPVRFVADGPDAGAAPLLIIATDGALPPASALAATGRLALAVHGAPARVPEPAPSAVRLADDAAVEPSVRGIELSDRLVADLEVDPAGEDVLAGASDGPVWARSRADVPVDRVRALLPDLDPGQVLYSLLSERAIAAVALVHFLRRACGSTVRRRRPRAAFVFDDPNLRWRSYGYIDYRRLVQHADEHGYHVAMAMIPLDAGRPHRPTAELFRARRDRLSLVVHGNDHVRNELLGMEDDGLALATAAQALRRVERFERRSGVPVDRVMMPPHGRCSRAMSRALAAVGFDALSAIHPLPWTAERPSAPPLAAWHPADFVGGCAVIPRTPLISTVADLALRAFLDHPMVVYGHHEDLAEGLEPLAEAAARVNRVGDVAWMSVGEIALGNFDARPAGGVLHVRPYSGRLALPSSPGADAVTVEEPAQAGGERALSGWSLDGGPVHAFGEVVPLGGARSLRLHAEAEVDPATVVAPPWRPWARLRRAGTELRDRALPLRPALRSR